MANKNMISEIKKIRQKSLCCPDVEIVKTRVVFRNFDTAPNMVFKNYSASRRELISFKALVKRSGRGRDIEFKRIGTVASNSAVLQGVQAVGSALTPGNLSMIRSPIRSSLTRTLTPGLPGLPGMRRGGDGYSRCPEGYQYGGRFTDNRFSTCGQKLFAIPGPLGAAISLLARTIRQESPNANTTATPLGAGQMPEQQGLSREPQIPKVTVSNPQKALAEVKKLVKPLGSVDTPTTRMVRRDGFVLEPVVPPSVLRTIPDNRDMEGATYMMSASSPDQIGQDELGLLSNTGVQSLKYVLPGGSVLTLEKRRQLSIGERRKLGRTVNTAIQSSNSNDPSSRLKMVAQETGEGISYSESFSGISNPNGIGKNGKQRWTEMAFRKRTKKGSGQAVETEETAPTPREQQTAQSLGGMITTVAAAIAHINRGGSLSKISPDILQQSLTKMSQIKRDTIGKNRLMLTMPNGDKYVEQSPSAKFEALAQRYASEVQQHLGVEAPNIAFLGLGDNRKYVIEDSETAVKGGKTDADASFSTAPFTEVARLMISDILTDTRNRNPGSVDIVALGGKNKIVPLQNQGAGLTDLSKISITERTKLSLGRLLSSDENSLYLKHFQELKEQQKAQYLKFIATLIERARSFNFGNFKSRLYGDGKLTSGEKIHLNIIQTLYETRLQSLTQQNESLSQLMSGKT